MNIGSTTFTVVDFQGQEAEYKEETGHSKTDSIYRRIPHQLLTGVASFNAFTHIFEKRDRSSNVSTLWDYMLTPTVLSFSLVNVEYESFRSLPLSIENKHWTTAMFAKFTQ